eukprot:2884981-Pleurochrysis_carterae.AAC.2
MKRVSCLHEVCVVLRQQRGKVGCGRPVLELKERLVLSLERVEEAAQRGRTHRVARVVVPAHRVVAVERRETDGLPAETK